MIITDLTTHDLTDIDLTDIDLTDIDLTDPVGIATRLHDDETGAQSMEYATLAAGGCGIAGILVALWESDAVQDRISGMLTGLLDTVSSGLTDLLPF